MSSFHSFGAALDELPQRADALFIPEHLDGDAARAQPLFFSEEGLMLARHTGNPIEKACAGAHGTPRERGVGRHPAKHAAALHPAVVASVDESSANR